MQPHKIEFIIDVNGFYDIIGRWPDDEAEYKHFCELCEKGLNSQIDWDAIFNGAKDAINNA